MLSAPERTFVYLPFEHAEDSRRNAARSLVRGAPTPATWSTAGVTTRSSRASGASRTGTRSRREATAEEIDLPEAAASSF